jgi:uncharacterized membrane protein
LNGPPSERTSTTGLDPRIASALAYLAGPFSGLLVLAAERANPDVRFHAWQSILGLGGLGVVVACLILGAFASIVVSATAFRVLLYTGWIVWAGWIVLWVICLAKAYAGERFSLPFVGGYAHHLAQDSDRAI